MPTAKSRRIYDRSSANKGPMTVTELCDTLRLYRHVAHAALAELATSKMITRDVVPLDGCFIAIFEVDRDRERRERREREVSKREADVLAELVRVMEREAANLSD